MKRKQGLPLLIASCIPGCGEMYQGYMKRGVSILTAFCALFTVSVFLMVEALTAMLIPIWLYSFFDSYNLRSLIDQGAEPPDAYLFGLSEMDSENLSRLMNQRHSLIGWGLVAIGVYVLWQTVMGFTSDIWGWAFGDEDWWLYHAIDRDIPRLVLTVLIIALGIWFIRGPKNPKKKDGDIPPFIPPAEEQEDGHGDN